MDGPDNFCDLSGLKSISTDFCKLGNDYIFSHITTSTAGIADAPETFAPTRVSGIAIVFMIKGSAIVEVNDARHELRPMSLLTVSHSSIIRVVEITSDTIDAYHLYLSSQFLKDINIDLNVFNFNLIGHKPSPVSDNLSVEEAKQMSGYMYLLFLNADANGETIYSKNIARSLTQALFYQMMQMRYIHSRELTDHDPDKPLSRQFAYVKKFMSLVQQHHAKERSLNFYADKLFISPKYLSRIIKDATGHSAAEWIDQFVLIDAKNMLRFSSKNVQQVAYALNFSTQSSFGKFFKHLTGMSPSEYQQT